MDLLLRTPKDPLDPAQVNLPQLYFGQGQNDLVVDTTGDFATVAGIDAMKQGVAKILVTGRGSNGLTPAYGSNLQTFLGQSIDIDFLRAQIRTELTDSLRIYQFINKDSIDLDEQIETLNKFNIDLVGSSSIRVTLQVTTRSAKVVSSIVSIES